MRLKRFIVAVLDRGCNLTHPVTHRRPWVDRFHYCPLAVLSFKLAERWGMES